MLRRWLRRRRGHSGTNTPAAASSNTNQFTVRFFSYETLRIATNNFSSFIDRGAYGSVFKCLLPTDGRTFAIKIIHNPNQDRFLEKVEFISHLRHLNLIQLIGCCVENHKQLLVYNCAENGTISQLLHFRKSSAFNWERRAAVCIGIARGLSYLHEEIDPGVIHRDIKPSNILLDANFQPKIADFGLMRFPDVEEEDSCVKGTPGYMDPNYMSTGELTDKVDVYSFGVTMLEIISGRRVVELSLEETEDRMLLDWVARLREEGTLLNIVDPELTDVPKEDAERFINVALLCTQAAPKQRPSMFQVVHMLYGPHKSGLEISNMAAAAVVAQPVRWFSGNSTLTSASTSSSSSLTTSTPGKASDITDGSSFTRMMDDASLNGGECSSKAARSGKEEEQSCEEDLVSAYFERSMEKIMRFQTAVHGASNRGTTTTTTSKTMVGNKSFQRVSMEAVYPPFPSGEYSRRPSHI